MSRDQASQSVTPSAQGVSGSLDALRQTPYLTFAQATIYVGSKNVRAFYEWRKRHGVPVEGDGTIARFLLDRVKRQPRRRRVIHPNSLRALRASQSQKAR